MSAPQPELGAMIRDVCAGLTSDTTAEALANSLGTVVESSDGTLPIIVATHDTRFAGAEVLVRPQSGELAGVLLHFAPDTAEMDRRVLSAVAAL